MMLMRWIILGILVLVISIGGARILGASRTDPSRAGPLVWEDVTHPMWTLSPYQDMDQEVHVLPPPPFTLEVAARFSPQSDFYSVLSLWLHYSADNGFANIEVSSYGSLKTENGESRWNQALLRTDHWRPVGEFNLLTLTVEADGHATLSLNGEIAWQSAIGFDSVPPPTQWSVGARSGPDRPTSIIWERMALYAPTGKP